MEQTPSGGSTAAVLQTMTLLSTLSTAVEVGHALRERRAGRDPSVQEEEGTVRLFLETAAGELEELLMRLQASLAHAAWHDGEGNHAGLVRRFDDLMLLHRMDVLLGVMHQRLLSLYPGVGEALVEEARVLQGAGRAAAAEGDGFSEAASRFVEQGLAFAAWVRQALAHSRR